MLRAQVIELGREDARRMRAAGTLPRGHATLAELTDPAKTVVHIAGTPGHDYRIERRLTR